MSKKTQAVSYQQIKVGSRRVIIELSEAKNIYSIDFLTDTFLELQNCVTRADCGPN